MAKLIANVMPEAVTPDWLAKTYSEYLYACAEDQIDLNNAISEACDNEQLNELIEDYQAVWDDNIDVINDAVTQHCLDEGLTIRDVQSRNAAFVQCMNAWTEKPYSLTQALNNMSTKFHDFNDADAAFTGIVINNVKVDDCIADQNDVLSQIGSIVSGIAAQFNIDDDYNYPLPEGFVPFKQMIQQIIMHTNLENTEEHPFLITNVKDSGGNNIGSLETNLTTVIDELKTAAASNIAWAQGFASCSLDSVSDRINNFVAGVKTAYSSAFTEAKTVFSNVQAVLSQSKLSVSNFISQAEQMIGWDKLVNDNVVVDDTDVANYTGASPYSGMDFHTAKGIADAVVTTVVAAGKAIWEGMKKIGKKIWGKVRPFVKAITTNPEDLSVIDKDAKSYQIENWSYNDDSCVARVQFSTTEAANALSQAIRSKFKDKTVALDCYFGTIIFTLNECLVEHMTTAQEDKIYVAPYFSYQFKPKMVNYEQAVSSGILMRPAGNYYVNILNNVSSFIDSLKAFTASNDMYLNDDAGEDSFATGLQAATVSMWGLGLFQLLDFHDQTSAWNGWTGTVFSHTSRQYDFSSSQSILNAFQRYKFQVNGSDNKKYASVTNLDFLKFASGYKGSDSYEDLTEEDGQFAMFHGTKNLTISDIMSLFIAFWVLQQNDRLYNPADFMFLPYTSDTFDFDPPRYAIKTDQQNANIVDVFLTVIVAVVVIAIVVLIGAKIAKTIKKAKFKKWTSIKGKLDNKIWTDPNGLTKKEWRKYLRADRKLSKLNLWSSGTAAANVISSAGSDSGLTPFLTNSSDSAATTPDDFTSEQLAYIRMLITHATI